MAEAKPLQWLLKRLLMLACVAVVVLILGGVLLVLQDRPQLDATPPPSPDDVATTRQLVRDIRVAAENDTVLEVDAGQLNSAMRLGARFVDGLRGQVDVEAGNVIGKVSIPVPWWGERKWVNLSGHVPEFDQHFRLTKVTVGHVELPPVLALALARTGANLGIGNRFGDRLIEAASSMTISGETLSFRLNIDDMGKNGLMRGAFGAMRGQKMPGFEEIESYHLLLRAAMAEGVLAPSGSFLPYLQFALTAALERSTPDTLPNAYTAAIFGLTKVCGARDFAMIVGRLGFMKNEVTRNWETNCDSVTFNGRIDSRRHFITSAALQAASNTGVAVSIGEFKELYDIVSGAGGFDFTDMAANLSGIRMSNVFMSASPDSWSRLLNGLEAENDVIIPFDGIPTLMPEAEFRTRFGDVDSDRYKEMLSRIEARIDQLYLHRP